MRLGLVQPNFIQGPKSKNAYYLPYSVGVLWAYMQTSQQVRENWTLDELVFQREPIEELAPRLAKCDVVGFSTYVWNHNYNYALAKRVKELNSCTLIVFGGPEVAITNPEVFQQYPFMDLIVKSEGEQAFTNILCNIINNHSFDNITGLLINVDGVVVNTGAGGRIEDLNTVPSPYLTGVFDELIAKHPTIEWNVILETNRGCPYQCTFCDWGSLTYSKVKKFPLDRVQAELEWFGSHSCGFMSVADANFGIFPERDNIIVDTLVSVQRQYGYPYRLNMAWAKNQKSEVVNIAKKLMGTVFNNGLTLSVQSLDDTVLSNIKRKNLEMNKLGEVFDLCNKANVPVCTELILGLPGETVASWMQNYFKLFELGQHNGIDQFHCQILENAEMNLTQRKEFDLKTVLVDDYMSGSYSGDEIKETVEVVVSTSTLNHEQMLDAVIFSWFINLFHIAGFSQFYARFARRHLGISYEEYYTKFWSWLLQHAWFEDERAKVRAFYDHWLKTGHIATTVLGVVEIHGWNAINRTLLEIHASGDYKKYNTIAEQFFRTIGEDTPLKDDLIAIQRQYVVQYGTLYPLQQECHYNVYEYLLGDSLTNELRRYQLDFPEDKTQDLPTFMQNVFYSRRRNFGKVSIT